MDFKSIFIGKNAVCKEFSQMADYAEITAGGSDIWGKSDELTFCYNEHVGDFTFICRIESFEKSDLYAKAGLMARAALEPNSAHAFLAVFPNNDKRNKNNGGYEFQYRAKDGKKSFAVYPADYKTQPPAHPANYPDTWVKLVRQNNNFTSYSSKDGQDWKFYSSCELPLPEKLYLGLAATAHNKKALTTVKFCNISIE